MPKYMYAANYTKQGLEGVQAKGGQARVTAIESLLMSLGGSLELFYFAFGGVDAYVIADLPDDETAAAVALAVSTSGAAVTHTTKLLTAEQLDKALNKTVDYQPPGT
jgi:uncharacterized protein with GYD domain